LSKQVRALAPNDAFYSAFTSGSVAAAQDVFLSIFEQLYLAEQFEAQTGSASIPVSRSVCLAEGLTRRTLLPPNHINEVNTCYRVLISTGDYLPAPSPITPARRVAPRRSGSGRTSGCPKDDLDAWRDLIHNHILAVQPSGTEPITLL
jgi:hypothetical protein